MKDAFGKRIQSLFALSSSSRAPRSERKRRLASGSLKKRGLQQDYAQSVKSSILSYYQSQNSSRGASLTRGKLCDQAEADARVAYYIATADADYAFNLAEIDAKEFALSTKLDLLAIWSRYVINQNWTYDTIKYGGYDSLTYSMIEPNHTYNIATAPFYGGAVTTIPTATYSERNAYFDGIVSASNQIVALKNAADSEDAAFATQNESTLAATKSANEATRENAEAATGDENAAYGAWDELDSEFDEIQPGDVVLAADHLSPEGSPAPACVARTFDNGLKDVVRLRFEGGEELVCTPSHRFYVSGRGWVCAESLQAGDQCVTANGDKVAFVERETLSEKAGVFNFEVEGRHTYFVGDAREVLVHNICSECKSSIFKRLKHFVTNCPEVDARNAEKMKERGLNPLSSVQIDEHTTVNLCDTETDHSAVAFSFARMMIWDATTSFLVPKCTGKITSKLARIIKAERYARPIVLTLHYDLRDLLNHSEEFDKLDDDKRTELLNARQSDEYENDMRFEHVYDVFGDGGEWIKLSPKEAAFHRKDCAKLVEAGGRELVINSSGEIEKRPQYKGTYNYVAYGCEPGKPIWKSVGHVVFDVVPYFLYGNSFDDPSNMFVRVYAAFPKPENKK